MIKTREEAIKYLHSIAEFATLPNYQIALRMAIEALQEVERLEETCENMRELIDSLHSANVFLGKELKSQEG